MLMATHAFKPTRARDRVLGLALTSPLLAPTTWERGNGPGCNGMGPRTP